MNKPSNTSCFECPCHQQLDCTKTDTLLKQHIKTCPTYRKSSPMANIFDKLRLNTFTTEQLKAIRSELGLMVEALDTQIQINDPYFIASGSSSTYQKDIPVIPNGVSAVVIEKERESNGLPNPSPSIITTGMPKFPESKPNNNSGINFGSTEGPGSAFDIPPELMEEEDSGMECHNGNHKVKFEEAVFLNSCDHVFCKDCLAQHIKNCFKFKKNTGCIKCNKALSQAEMKGVVGDKIYDELERGSLLDTDITTCVNPACKHMFMFEAGKLQGNMKDEAGNKLTQVQELHYAQNRFKCPKCQTEQCKSCGGTPYTPNHMGKTCEELKKFKSSKRCKYCENTIKNAHPEFPDVCTNDPECVEKTKNACKKVLECGHSCCGYKGEKNCLPCLDTECCKKNAANLKGQKGEDMCSICYTERLINAPCIRSTCGHIFHLSCITTRIEKRWHRPRITFGFCFCPNCKMWLEFPEDSDLQQKIKMNKAVLDEIKHKSNERLKYEKREKDERLHKVGDQYYQKPEEYALAIYSYYMCFKCKKPYFGGLKSCELLMEEEKNQSEFKSEELVCAKCSSQGMPLESCGKHGTEFIEFKCKFCCSVAQWFCWGNTHFCDQCHQKQVNGDYVSKKPKADLPKCKGKGECPLKMDHKGNGDEFALGCSLCRNLMNSHDF